MTTLAVARVAPAGGPIVPFVPSVPAVPTVLVLLNPRPAFSALPLPLGAIRSIVAAAADDSVLWDVGVRTVDPEIAAAGSLPAADGRLTRLPGLVRLRL
jgi:hypothetical protein